MSRFTALIFMIIVLVVGGALRLLELDGRSFWFDESFSYTLAHDCSWTAMLDRTGRDVHPPLYYALLRIWIACFGTAVVTMRGLAVFAAEATLVGLYLFCRDGLASRDAGDDHATGRSRTVGVAAASLLAVSSIHIRSSQETRMYTLGTALAVFSSWTLVRALTSQRNRFRWWAAYSVLAAAFLYTHNYALFTFVGQAVYVLGRFLAEARFHLRTLSRSRRLWEAATAIAAGAWLYMPWFPVLLQQKNRVQTEYWIAKLRLWTVPDKWFALFFPTIGNFSTNSGAEKHVCSAVLAGITVVILFLVWVRGGACRRLIVSLVVMPILCAVVVSQTTVSIVELHHFIFAQLFLFCAAADVLCRWPNRTFQATIWGLLLTCSLSLEHHRRKWLDLEHRPGIRGAVETIIAQRAPDEPVVVLHPCVFFAVRYYLDGIVEPKLYLSPARIPHFLGGPIIRGADLISAEQLRNVGARRIWVVDTTGFGFPPIVRATLPGNWVRETHATASFPEPYWFQGTVRVTAMARAGDDELPPTAERLFETYDEDFRKPLRTEWLGIFGEPSSGTLSPGAKGLRIRFAGEKAGSTSAGVEFRSEIRGDFEITESFEIVDLPQPPADDATGFGIALSGAKGATASLRRERLPEEGDVYVVNQTVAQAHGGRVPDHERFPALSNLGRLRIQRIGTTLIYSASEGHSGPLPELLRMEFSGEDLNQVQFEAQNCADNFEVRVKSVLVRADSFLRPSALDFVEATTFPGEVFWSLWIAAPAAVALVWWLGPGRKFLPNEA
jgi:hypothetical protein